MAFKGITAFILNNGEGGGGGGGSTNYNDLTNHPQVNGNELIGNKTADQLGLLPADTDIPTKLSDLDADATHRTVTDSEKQSWNNKVDSVAGKGLSTNDYTDDDQEDVAKVDGLVSSVGGLTSRVGIAEGKVRTLEGEMLSVQNALDTKVDKETGKGLSTNDYSNADKAIVDGVTTALAGKVDTSSVGANNGVAGLDNTGRVPSSQLPSYVDDVLEYASLSAFPVTGESGKIYVALDTNKEYRWSGSAYAVISESLALGETQGTAYEGNKGKANADAIAAIQGTINGLGTASTKNSTSVVTESSDLVESGAVKDAIVGTTGWIGGNLLIFPYDAQTTTYAWGTVTVNGDGSITVNGTPTERIAIKLETPAMNYDLPNGDYILSLENAQSGSSLLVEGYNGLTWYKVVGSANVDNPSVSISIDHDGYTNLSVYIAINSGTTLNNVTFKPMISKRGGSFVPYHPSVEQTLRDAEVIEGKNKIPFTLSGLKVNNTQGTWSGNTYTVDGVTYTIMADGEKVTEIILNNTSSNGHNFYLAKNVSIASADYIFTTGLSSNSFIVLAADKTGGGKINVFTKTEGTFGVTGNVFLSCTANTTFSNVLIKPMLCLATENDTFEPYYIPLKDVVPNKCDNSTIAPTENGTTISQAYAVGTHAIRNGAFITWKNAKAQGEPINDESDYTAGDVADSLTNVENDLTVNDVTSEFTLLTTNLSFNSTYSKIYKQGNLITVNLRFTASNALSGNVAIFTKPTKYQPKVSHIVPLYNLSNHECVGLMFVDNVGTNAYVAGANIVQGTEIICSDTYFI